jgi:DNA primase
MSIRDDLKHIPVDRIIALDFPLTRSGERYFRAVPHDSLVIDTKKNLFFWNSIGVSGDGYDWLTKVRGLSSMEAIKILQQYTNVPIKARVDTSLFTPSGPYYKLLSIFHELGKGHRDFWYERGYTDDTIDLFQLGWTGKYYVVPIIHDGKLLNFQCRTKDKRMWSWTKGLGKLPFNFSAIKDNEYNWIIITESLVDCIIATQYGYPAVSISPNALGLDNRFVGHFHGIPKIYLMFDNDKAGKRGMKNVAKKFPNRSWVPQWEGYPDKADVGDVLKDEGPYAFENLLDDCLPSDVLDSPFRKELYISMREAGK